MQARKLVGAALLVTAVSGLAVAGERDGIPEKVRAAAAKLFKGEDVKFSKVAVYEVKGRGAAGREIAVLITEEGAPFRALAAMPQNQTPPNPGARAFLGIRFASATEATVAGTIPGTAAEKAGLKSGDRIVQVGEKPVASASELGATLGACQPGQRVKLVVERDGWRKSMEVTLGARPANLDDDGDDDHDDDDKGGGKHDERGERHEKGEKDDDE